MKSELQLPPEDRRGQTLEEQEANSRWYCPVLGKYRRKCKIQHTKLQQAIKQYRKEEKKARKEQNNKELKLTKAKQERVHENEWVEVVKGRKANVLKKEDTTKDGGAKGTPSKNNT